MRAAHHRRAAGVWMLATACTVGLGACGLGERPTLTDPTAIGGLPGTPTGAPAADAVLHVLEAEPAPDLTATYTVTTSFGGAVTPATLVRSGGQQSLTIGDVRFLTDSSGGKRTCDLITGACEDGIQEARVSNTSVTSQFYGASPARALRVTLSRRTGEPTGTTESIAGQTATCVSVPAGPGKEVTCVVPQGVLARWQTAAVDVELQTVDTTADPNAFATTH